MFAGAHRCGTAALAVAGLFIWGCGGAGSGNTQAGPSGCQQASPPAPKSVHLRPPPPNLARGQKLVAVVTTSCGAFDVALDTKRAPKTTSSFVYLARKGFYNGLDFHRIAPNFVIQGGDPLGNGTGGPGYYVDEKPPRNLAYTKGVVAMAKAAGAPSGQSGSQFFIITTADSGLPPDYALVGRVSKGFDVVQRIAALGTQTEKPTQTVLIQNLTIQKG